MGQCYYRTTVLCHWLDLFPQCTGVAAEVSYLTLSKLGALKSTIATLSSPHCQASISTMASPSLLVSARTPHLFEFLASTLEDLDLVDAGGQALEGSMRGTCFRGAEGTKVGAKVLSV